LALLQLQLRFKTFLAVDICDLLSAKHSRSVLQLFTTSHTNVIFFFSAEIGATTSLFPFNDRMYDYLAATKRKDIGDFSRAYAKELKEDEGAEYDQVIEIDLNELEPHINGPFTPDLATPISKFSEAVKANGWPEELKVGLIGSCTNSSYEDMSRAASIARDALNHGVKAKSLFTVTPGSEQVSTVDFHTYLES